VSVVRRESGRDTGGIRGEMLASGGTGTVLPFRPYVWRGGMDAKELAEVERRQERADRLAGADGVVGPYGRGSS
jgi:hypothetical protein